MAHKPTEVDLAAIAASLVHEIKNPLSTLNITAQLLLEEWKDAEEPRERRTQRRLKIILSEVRRLEAIVETFTRFVERHELKLEPTSMNELLEEAVEVLAEAARQKGIQIRLSADPDCPKVRIDRGLLQQAILNLMLNAEHAMKDGGDLIVKSRHDSDWVVIDVIDTGEGILAENLGRIFDLYYSSKPGGGGLGLATTKRIVEEHGGQIEVTSEKGKGSQFTVKLPLGSSG